jgi:SAM-dependent methyltransferase
LQRLQELAHGGDFDYRAGSPHLKHRSLYDRLVSRLVCELEESRTRGLPPTLLEIGAGDGAFVEPALAFGARVTATEMSRPAIATLQRRFGANPAFAVAFVDDDTPPPFVDGRFSVILFASVLHHIPDYLGTVGDVIRHHLAPGGTFISFQDPLWYPSVGRGTRLLSEAAYLSWRVGQGNLTRGIQTRLRRLRGVYDDTQVSDSAEYHAVREGIDHQRLVKSLSGTFETVELVPYWSSQAALWQRLGERIGRPNTFALVARGFRE